MNKIYESTRNNQITSSPSNAIIKGLASDGGLFVLPQLDQILLEMNELKNMDYAMLAQTIFEIFLDDFTKDEIKNCIENAYNHKFSTDQIDPLIKLNDGYILELFNGPTSAFKDFGLQMLPQLMQTALKKNPKDNKILILTATSGDTGKAAMEGFKDVAGIEVIVFYPKDGVSKVQELQMQTQLGKNVRAVAINGNFDDAQSKLKELFNDEDFKQQLLKQKIQLSSANSINIGRLIPQIIYYFDGYFQLVRKKEIKLNEQVNFIVPTGNFGNILAGYYAKLLGLPINKLVCASNENNVLYDFIKTGVYDKNREFLKTLSPSMDILISSNLERLLYYASGKDNEKIEQLMLELTRTGKYSVNGYLFKTIQANFSAGYATNDQCANVIKEIYENEDYLLDPHSAVAYKVLLDSNDLKHKSIVLATASPYKFVKSVYTSLFGPKDADEFELMHELEQKTKTFIPNNLKDLDQKKIIHDEVINKNEMKQYVLEKIKEI